MKYATSQECPCKRDGWAWTGGFPSDDCHNNGPTLTPPPRGRPQHSTAPSITTNMNWNSTESTEADLIIFQVSWQVVFQSYEPEFTPPPRHQQQSEWPALPASTETALKSHILTKTAATDTSKPAAIRCGKKIHTTHNQRMFQTQNPYYLPTLIVKSHQRSVQERMTTTQIMSSCPKIANELVQHSGTWGLHSRTQTDTRGHRTWSWCDQLTNKALHPARQDLFYGSFQKQDHPV